MIETIILLVMIASLCAIVIAGKRFLEKSVAKEKNERGKENKWEREGVFILGGIAGVIFVRAFLLDEIEKIGFSMVMNHLDRLSSSDFQTITNSSTFLKCAVGFCAGGLAATFTWRRYSKPSISPDTHMVCPDCGEQVLLQALVCKHCGSKFKVEEKKDA